MSSTSLVRKASDLNDPRPQKRYSYETLFKKKDYEDIASLDFANAETIEEIHSVISEKYWKSHEGLIKDVFFKFSKREIVEMVLPYANEKIKTEKTFHKLYLGICYTSNVRNYVASLKKSLDHGTNYLDIINSTSVLRDTISDTNEYLANTELFFLDDLEKKRAHLARIKNAFLLTQNSKHAHLGISWGRYNYLDPALELLNPKNELALSDERLYNQLQLEYETIQNNYISFRESLENVSKRVKDKIDELSSLS